MNFKQIALSVFIVSLGLLAGRISGFFREIVIANIFGANESSDFIVILLTTPDFLVSLLMGGALSMSLIPEFKCLNMLRAKLLFQQVTTLMFLLGGALVLIGYLFKGELLSSLALGMDIKFVQSNQGVFFLSLLALPLSLASGASLAYLNSQERFTVTSLGTLIVNLTIIIAIILASVIGGGFIYIAVSIVIAAMLRWLSQIISIGYFPLFTLHQKEWLVTKELVKRYVYALLSGGIIFALPVVVRTVASIEGEGALSLVNYTIKLVELPLIVLSSAFSIVLLPKLSSAYADGDDIGFFKMASASVFLVLFISLLVLMLLREYSSLATHVVYGWGALRGEQLESIARYLSVYAWSLPFQCVNGIFLAVFSARRDTKVPFVITTLLGGGFFLFLLLYQPRISHLLQGLVIFYAVMAISLAMMVKIKHQYFLFSGFSRLSVICTGVLILVYALIAVSKNWILSFTPLVSVALLGSGAFVMMMFLLLLIKLKNKK